MMNYQWHYDRLIDTRKERVPEDGKYYERHHVVPRSMGGDNSLGNLLLLTAREHFIAHWLLWRIHRNKETAFAFRSMCNYKNKKAQGKQRMFSSIGYSESKEAFACFVSKLLKGTKRDDNTRKKLSKVREKYWASMTSEERSNRMTNIKSFCTHEQRIKGAIKTNLSYTHERRSKIAKEINDSLTEEQKTVKSQKIRKSKSEYWANLTPDERSERMKKLNEAKKLKNNR